VLPLWLGSVDIVVEGAAPLGTPGNAGRHILAYCPHGLYPVGAGYLPLLPAFREKVGLRPVTLIASVCFQLPFMRDILSWLGMRVVSRASFRRALAERGSVLVVPGGQAELVHAHELPSSSRFVVYAGHKGELAGGVWVRCAVCAGHRGELAGGVWVRCAVCAGHRGELDGPGARGIASL
jgi:2-acylglycerol O-acyltransferase 2